MEISFDELVFRLTFHFDKGARRLESVGGGERELELKLFNFVNALGTGTTEPLQVGTYMGKKLWLSFVVYSLDATTIRTIHYTFFGGD